jgi:glycosyltransferase involved in cell wall biosynthesis
VKILFFSYYNPLGKGGFEKQGMGLMKTLANQGHEIVCLTISTPSNQAQIQSELEATKIFKLGCFVIPHQEKKYSLKAKVLFWLSFNPIDVMIEETPELKSKINLIVQNIIDKQKTDVIHCLSLRTAYYLMNFVNTPLVLDLVDAYSNHKKRTIKYHLSHFDFRKTFSLIIDLIKTVKIEKSILKKYTRSPVAVVSPIDQKILSNISHSSQVYNVTHPVTIKPNTNKQEHDSQLTITFYGYLEQRWNSDALNYLINEIIPIVLQKHPDLKLLITGINLSEKIFKLEEKFNWITVVPTVNNIEEFASQSTLNCWPFRLGSGFKNKIIESMALSKPVVTTTIGTEALTESQKKGLLIADDSQGLAAHVIYLLDNPNERLRLGEINHQIAIKDFTWEKKAQDYLKLYQLAQQQIKDKDL